MIVSEPAWKAANRAHWDEKVAVHLGPRGYDLTSLCAGRGRFNFFAPYFSRDPVVMEETHDYVDETTTVRNATTHTWIHPLGDIISGLLAAGMTLDWLHEHDALTWHMFDVLVRDAERLWRWPDKPWLPLAFSLKATRR